MKTPPRPRLTRRVEIIGWLTIFTQVAFPLSMVYSPVALAVSQKESDATGKWYQSGNQNPQPSFNNDPTRNPFADIGSPQEQSGSFDTAAGMARSAGVGAVNNSVEAWLSQFGTARVQLNLDDKFKLDGSEADLLVPLYDSGANLLFTQLGFRHVDGRNTGNFGVGARHFTGDWMLGVNAFFDNDFTGENRRMGVGLEAWRDYLKISANSYIRLSDWQQSRDFADYDERPANGYDLRVEGWLPSYPQLGAKFIYEQYQGDDVALFGKDNRQQDPWAFTGGVSYTPVPLITLGAQHRAGKDGENDSQISLQMNYRLGESWDKQIDPEMVGASRTLSGTRYDLVERNNNIVLDYRKQQSINLILPEKVTGKGGTTVPVTFEVQTKEAVQRIDWEATSLVAAGGTVTQVGSNTLNVTLPPFLAGSTNVHTIAGVAYDVNGNSGSARTQVQVQVGDVSVGETKVSATPATIIADGKETSVVSIELFDANANPVSGMAASLKASLNETPAAKQPAAVAARAVQPARIGDITEASPGVYQTTVTAGNRVSSLVITPEFEGKALPEAVISQTADTESAQLLGDNFAVVVDNSVANGIAANKIRARVTDAGNNPLADMDVTFSLSGSAKPATGSSLNAVSDEKGQVVLEFVNTVAEPVTVTAALANGSSANVIVNFVADGSTGAIGSGDLAVDKTEIVANNSDAATYTAVVKDANGNAVANATVSWATDFGSLSGSSSTTDAEGKATVKLTGTVAGTAQVTAQTGGAAAVNAPAVELVADGSTGTIGSGDLAVDKTEIVADNSDAATYTAVVKDANGNAVANATVSWVTDLGSLSGSSSTTDAQGKATVRLTGTVAGTAQVTAQTGGAAAVNAPAVELVADGSTGTIGSGDLAVDKTEIVANNSDAATYTAVVKDANGNAVANATVSWATDLGSLSGSSSTTDAEGKATVKLTGTLAGTAQVTAQTGGAAAVNAPAVELVADGSTGTIGSGDLAVDKAKVVANNTDAATYTAIVKDAHGNAVKNATVNWTTDLGSLSGSSSTTDAEGKATIKLTGTLAGAAQVTAQTGSAAVVNAPAVELVADVDTRTISNVVADKTTIVADGTDQANYVAMVKDANGNAVTNTIVHWTTDRGTLGNNSSSTDDKGMAFMRLTGTQAGTAQVTAQTGSSAAVNAPTVTLTAGALDQSQSTLAVSKASINADDRTGSVITFTAKDAHGNVISGLNVALLSTLANSQVTPVVDNDNGTYTANIEGTKTGLATITVQVAGAPVTGPSAAVTITPGAWNMDQSSGLMTVSQPTEFCSNVSGAFKRNYVTMNAPVALFDKHGNNINGKLKYNIGRVNTTTIQGKIYEDAARPNLVMDASSVAQQSFGYDKYTTNAKCTAERVVSSNVTVTLTGVTDDFGTKPVNKVFKLGSGSPR